MKSIAQYEAAYCIQVHEEDYVMNGFAKYNSSNFNIYLNYCKDKCNSTREQTNAFISGKYFGVAYVDNFVDAYDYDAPIK